MSRWTLENETFSQFAFYSGVVLTKTLLMSPLTTLTRINRKVWSSPEDVRAFCPDRLATTSDEVVERIRRCHLNDLENVIPFTLIGLLYVNTNPDPSTAAILFKTFTFSRVLHTVAYLAPLPQPTRAIAYLVGVGVSAYMAFVLLHKVATK